VGLWGGRSPRQEGVREQAGAGPPRFAGRHDRSWLKLLYFFEFQKQEIFLQRVLQELASRPPYLKIHLANITQHHCSRPVH
jgi:hypothetical protein